MMATKKEHPNLPENQFCTFLHIHWGSNGIIFELGERGIDSFLPVVYGNNKF